MSKFFLKTNKIVQACRASAICGLNKCLFIPNCMRKIMCLHVNNKQEKIRDSLSQLSISKVRSSSTKIIYSNCVFGQNNRI